MEIIKLATQNNDTAMEWAGDMPSRPLLSYDKNPLCQNKKLSTKIHPKSKKYLRFKSFGAKIKPKNMIKAELIAKNFSWNLFFIAYPILLFSCLRILIRLSTRYQKALLAF